MPVGASATPRRPASPSPSVDDGEAAATLDTATTALRDWLTPFLGATDVAVAPIPPREVGAAKGAWLALETAATGGRAQAGNAITVLLGYRLLLDLQDPLTEQRLLGEILFATVEHPLYASEHGLRQEPSGTSIALSSRLVRHPQRRPAPPVRLAPRPRIGGVQALEGVVLGPDDIPLADVTVTLGESGLTKRTDPNGRFAFPALPSDRPAWRLTIQAKGRRFAVDATAGTVCVARIPLGD